MDNNDIEDLATILQFQGWFFILQIMLKRENRSGLSGFYVCGYERDARTSAGIWF
jgi:hypothetical protein